jgi:hypothetical protein
LPLEEHHKIEKQNFGWGVKVLIQVQGANLPLHFLLKKIDKNN